ncbi:heterogeneous nuclear ribonucleoprotein HRP1 [Histoplasma capsulatum]|uniref:Heterogeneous nuclear ribonucleoprotein HRP1 n=1 Tax=Ajellomyces capsulatus TaxID=5037 RepID=A0A8A1MAE1_AJECA|nr:heterogeneous nuclear ribonucleoprotein HRP1 [Histoplasma capsulatum]
MSKITTINPTLATKRLHERDLSDHKMFIGGLNWETTDQSLKDYFSQFGEVQECTVMRDGASGRSRGFGFLTFKDPKTVNTVMVKEHYLDGKIIDPKRAIPRDEQERTSKIFVGGVSQEATEQDFKQFFMQFGRVVDATLMIDKDSGRPRGFGFVTFDSEAAVEATLSGPLEILGKPIEVKKAQPRGNMRDEDDRSRGSRRGTMIALPARRIRSSKTHKVKEA